MIQQQQYFATLIYIGSIEINSFQLFLTELSSQSENMLPNDPDEGLVIEYYEDQHGHLVSLINANFRVETYGDYRVGVIIEHHVCPIFDNNGHMVVVDRITRAVLRMYPDHVYIARRYRFVDPERQRLIR